MTKSRKRLLAWTLTPLLATALIAAAGAAWWRWDTGRQPAVGDAVAVMNRAVADTVTAAGPGAAIAVGGVVRSRVCRLNAIREGGVFTASGDLYTDPGTEGALIDGIAQRLPRTYTVRRGAAASDVRSLEADIAGGVTLSVRRLSAGWLTVSSRTQCSLGAAAGPAAAPPDSAGAAAITATFTALGTRTTAFRLHRLDCPTGPLVTVSAVSDPVDTANLSERLAATVPPGARRFEAPSSNRLVYRDGAVSVVLAASDEGTAVTSQHTTAC